MDLIGGLQIFTNMIKDRVCGVILSCTMPHSWGKWFLCYNEYIAPVAQGIELRFPKPRVIGSNPIWGTTVDVKWTSMFCQCAGSFHLWCCFPTSLNVWTTFDYVIKILEQWLQLHTNNPTRRIDNNPIDWAAFSLTEGEKRKGHSESKISYAIEDIQITYQFTTIDNLRIQTSLRDNLKQNNEPRL